MLHRSINVFLDMQNMYIKQLIANIQGSIGSFYDATYEKWPVQWSCGGVSALRL